MGGNWALVRGLRYLGFGFGIYLPHLGWIECTEDEEINLLKWPSRIQGQIRVGGFIRGDG